MTVDITKVIEWLADALKKVEDGADGIGVIEHLRFKVQQYIEEESNKQVSQFQSR